MFQRVKNWVQMRSPEGESPWDGDVPAWFASLAVHLCVLAVVAAVGTAVVERKELFRLLAEPVMPEDLMAHSEEFSTSEIPQQTIGSSSGTSAEETLAAAPVLADIATMPTGIESAEQTFHVTERIQIQDDLRLATAPKFTDNLVIRGAAGVGATGTSGAVDRITQEIMQSLAVRRTLVVWLFDQSGSLAKQRSEIIKRFDRIYEELGVIEASGNPAFKKYENKPLLSAIIGFGKSSTPLVDKPTDDIEKIKAAIDGMKTDESGLEYTFAAVREAAERYRRFTTQEPRRNVMFVLFTDETGDDEAEQLERAVAICRRNAITVYCVGVPAPFGRRDASIKYVDPDPKYDQTPQWIRVRQGPESYLPELVSIGGEEGEEPMDSGFGPYSLTRLCVETGGIFFAVHPNREEGRMVSRRETAELASQLSYFFDPELMQNYRPDYVPIKEYQRLLAENKACAALVEAAQVAQISRMERPDLVFPKVSDADLVNRLSRGQQASAILEPKLNNLYEILRQGEKDRAKLTRPRWQAGYDLSMGRLLAVKVRTESYNAMLGKAKLGMKFTDPKNDTWRLVPDAEISVGSTQEKQAQQARTYLERVVHDHPRTPWALLAERELKEPLGWTWQETYTGVNAPRQVAAAGNQRPPRDDKAKMIKRPERRPPPKL